MKNTLRGRPRLDLELDVIIEAVRRHGKVLRAAHELGCSDAYIHQRFKEAGLTLQGILEVEDKRS
ncbi:MAG: hypothetical protein Q7K03_06000 [Dehalococcoidia bacterium]|nr:hypothetical protein [Dehalococcoidia bacterium]